MKRMLCLLACLVFGQGAWAVDTADCWYPVDAPIGCQAGGVDYEGYLRAGVHAVLANPVNRYGHGILGNTPEWGSLQFVVQGSPRHGPYVFAEYVLPKDRIFEDVIPRLVDVDGDDSPEIVVVETDIKRGARLSVYAVEQGEAQISLLAATPHIGRPYRWLAPVGVADFNGDGLMDFAYVDRPHLAKTLRVWTLKQGRLLEIASLRGVSNHNIGDESITGGLRDCGAGPEMVVVDAGWRNVLGVRLTGDKLGKVELGRYKGPKSMQRALHCQ